MENKDYVNLEVAQMLKDTTVFINGFKYIVTEDIDKDPYGNSYKKGDISHYGFEYNNKVVTLLAPSLWDTHKWLREQYGLAIELYRDSGHWCYNIVDMYGNYNPGNYQDYNIGTAYNHFETFEEALNEGIKEVLKLI